MSITEFFGDWYPIWEMGPSGGFVFNLALAVMLRENVIKEVSGVKIA